MVQAVKLRCQTPQPRIGNHVLDRAAARRRHRQHDLPVLDAQAVIADLGDGGDAQAAAGGQQRDLPHIAAFQHQFGRLRFIAADVQAGRTAGHRGHQRRQIGQAAAFAQHPAAGRQFAARIGGKTEGGQHAAQNRRRRQRAAGPHSPATRPRYPPAGRGRVGLRRSCNTLQIGGCHRSGTLRVAGRIKQPARWNIKRNRLRSQVRYNRQPRAVAQPPAGNDRLRPDRPGAGRCRAGQPGGDLAQPQVDQPLIQREALVRAPDTAGRGTDAAKVLAALGSGICSRFSGSAKAGNPANSCRRPSRTASASSL